MSFDGYQRKYSPTQPRRPRGSPQGGQWAAVGAWSGHSNIIEEYVSAHGPGAGAAVATADDGPDKVQGDLGIGAGAGGGYVQDDRWPDPEAIEAARVEEERLATQAAWQETKERYFGDPSEHGLDYAEGGNPLIDFTPDDDQLREIGLDPDDPDFDPDDYYTIEAALMEHRFGSDYADMAQLVGAPNGARVEARWTSWEEIEIYTEHEFYDGQQHRTLMFDDYDGSMSMYNHSFTLTDDAPPGLGSLVVQMQMGTAKNMGVTSVDVQAAGHPGSFMNGYYTWPRLGYDTRFGLYDRAKLASSPKPDAVTVQDLFATPGGAAWWKENGWGMAMTFNLSTPDALNRLDAYVDGKLGNAPPVPKSWGGTWLKYAPGQARVPAGSPAGGQFAGHGSGGGGTLSFAAVGDLLYGQGDPPVVRNRNRYDPQEETDRHSMNLFGRHMSDQDIAALVGAPHGSTVAYGYTLAGKLEVSVEHPMFDGAQERIIRLGPDDKPYIYNNHFVLKKDAPPGTGTHILNRQVEFARSIGIDRIGLWAGGSPARDAHNGYYTWPRLGFDAPLDSGRGAQVITLPPEHRGARSLHELFAQPGGKEWWKANGKMMAMDFDTRADSASSQVLSEYMAERQARVKSASVKYAPGQARVPAGSPHGGQFAAHGGGPGAGRVAALEQTRLSLYGPDGTPPEVGVRGPWGYGWDDTNGTERKRHEQAFFGRTVTNDEYAALVGAPNGSSVEVAWDDTGKFSIHTSHPLYQDTQARQFFNNDGHRFVYNQGFSLKDDAPAGVGTLVLGAQVNGLKGHGFDHIKTNAAGRGEARYPGAPNGYYTWARLGFNREFDTWAYNQIPPEFGNPKSVGDLMSTPAGRDWWRDHGWGIQMEFDLKPGSRSRAVLDSYVLERYNPAIKAWLDSFAVKYNPTQPRHPAGAPRGGQWAAAGGGPKQPGLPNFGPIMEEAYPGWHRDGDPYVAGGGFGESFGVGSGAGTGEDAPADDEPSQTSAARWQKTKDELYGPGGTPPVVDIEDEITEVYDEDSGDYIEFSPDEMSERMFGRVLTQDDYAALVGAPNGSSVHVDYGHDGDYETLEINTNHPYYASSQRRTFGHSYDDAMGDVVFGAHNDYFEVRADTPDGVGALVLQRQVEGLRRLGIDHIGVQAAGDPSNFIPGGGIRGMIGYYVWPRLGFNGEVLGHDVRHGPDWMSDIHDMHGIFAHPDGPAWWKENGWPMNLAFDTWAGSTSSDVLDRYIADKLAGRKTWAWRIAYQRKYSPTQPRNPAGTTTGGRFRSAGVGAGAAPRTGGIGMIGVGLDDHPHPVVTGKPMADWTFTDTERAYFGAPLTASDMPDGGTPYGFIAPQVRTNRAPWDVMQDGQDAASAWVAKAEVETFGREMTSQDYADLVGAPNGSLIHIQWTSRRSMRISTKHSQYELQSRTVERLGDELHMDNSNFALKHDAPKGLGALVLGKQVRSAHENGIPKIGTGAAGSPQELGHPHGLIGYYAWPRLGFNAELGYRDREKLPEAFRSASDVQGVMQMPGGRDAWRDHGSGMSMEFDTRPGSVSSAVLSAYLDERRSGVVGKSWAGTWRKYSPTQPRNPAGTTGGGQFRNVVGGGMTMSAGNVFTTLDEQMDLDPAQEALVIGRTERRTITNFGLAEEVIDGVHGSSTNMAEVDVGVMTPADGVDANGLVAHRRIEGGDIMITGLRVNPKLDEAGAVATIMHEYGHVLDIQVFGEHKSMGSETNPKLKDLMLTIHASRGANRLSNSLLDNPINAAQKRAFASFIAYQMSDRELFARAYMQWVATRSKSDIASEIRRRLPHMGGDFPNQWGDDDFAPIGEAFDELFSSYGLAR